MIRTGATAPFTVTFGAKRDRRVIVGRANGWYPTLKRAAHKRERRAARGLEQHLDLETATVPPIRRVDRRDVA